MKVDPTLIHRLLYPQVPLIMAAQYKGRVSAMPVVSYTLVSDVPPVIVVACKPEGFTCKLALKAKGFSLSVTGRQKLESLSKLATLSGTRVEDKLRAAGLEHHRGTKVKAPIIQGAEATLQCTLRSHNKVGDHLLLTATVREAVATGAFSDFWNFQKYHPVLYTGWREGLTTYQED